MIEISTEVTGVRELRTTFDGMTEDLRSRLRALLPQAGEDIRAAAAAAAPRSPKRSSASKKYGPLHSRVKAKFSAKRDVFTESVSFGSAFYGMFMESGLNTMRRPPRKRGIVGVTVRHLKGGGVSTSARRGLLRRQGGASTPFNLAPHPFMTPAFTSRREAITERILHAALEAAK